MLSRSPMRRKGWTKPERKWPVLPETPPAPVGTMRSAAAAPVVTPKDEPYRSEAYRRFVASHACFSCGIAGFSQCAHANFAKALGMKTSDLETFPLCGPHGLHNGCHFAFDLCLDMTRDDRRELEQEYVARMQEIARAAGRPEFREAS
jgi:hypothetical protein